MDQESETKHSVDEQLGKLFNNVGEMIRNNMLLHRQVNVESALDKMLERGDIIEKDGKLWLPFLDAKHNEYVCGVYKS